jgi:hypothetical protein
MKENVAKCDFFTDKYTFKANNDRQARTEVITAAPKNKKTILRRKLHSAYQIWFLI